MGTLNKTGNELWAEQTSSEKLDYSLDWSDFGEPVTASVWTADAPVVTSDASVAGQITTCFVTGGNALQWYRVTNTVSGASGRSASKTIMLFVKDADVIPLPMGSPLFPNKFGAVAELRRDRLLTSVKDLGGLSDDFLWKKLQIAEAELRHRLRVPFAPTRFLPREPSADEIAALGSMPWEIDPGYDYDAAFFQSDRWGFLQLRNKPLVSVQAVKVMMPGVEASFDVPLSWLRMDRKYAEVQFVPTSEKAGVLPLSAFMLQTVSLGRSVPFSIHVTYTAGIENVTKTFPDLVDVACKLAVLSAIGDSFIPQSGSISADGLSQSVSTDMQKYRDDIDVIIDGAKGSNGGITATLHGVRLGVLG